jgi:biotin synthase
LHYFLEEFDYFYHKNRIYEHYKHNWTKEEIIAIYNKPMMDLLYEAVHREHHDPNGSGINLLSIKLVVVQKIAVTAPQRYHTSVEGNDLMSVSQVKAL